MSAEEWRPIPGYPGYEASERGQIRSWKSWRGQAGPRTLHQALGNRGYYRVSLCAADAPYRKLLVHALVALAFHGPRPDEFEVRHLDGDRTNNAAANLAYGTHAENYGDMFTHGTHPMARRTHCKQGHAFSPDNVRWEIDRKGSAFRRCLTCARKAHGRAAA